MTEGVSGTRPRNCWRPLARSPALNRTSGWRSGLQILKETIEINILPNANAMNLALNINRIEMAFNNTPTVAYQQQQTQWVRQFSWPPAGISTGLLDDMNRQGLLRLGPRFK